jgi:hypothetical protein
MSSTTEFAAFVGIDWGDRKHDVCLQACGSSKREFAVLPYRPEAIDQWAQALAGLVDALASQQHDRVEARVTGRARL